MANLPVIEMTVVSDLITATDSFQDMLTVADVDATISIKRYEFEGYTDPVRLNALFLILVLKGEAKISLDYIHYTISPNMLVTVMPVHILQAAEVSPDFKAVMIMIHRSFLEGLNIAQRTPSMTNYMLLRKNPCTNLLPEETLHLENCTRQLREKIHRRTHAFHKELMQNAFVALMLEMADIMVGKKDTVVHRTLSRKEEIMNKFVNLLIRHGKREHHVSFYAAKLFITPQYLSLILKELSGKSANKWIDEALVMEAGILLKTPELTVQQVADELNFSDQSTFGKFFKKNTGLSPMEYRKV
ncbi:MAG: helix-turn-helix domain-containing protein [Tannerellaceae bacterium]|jgi:AraC-like DNA-binding protein|nr:helix-turn-helix domain-containing protein [Tannerellaceae bacterium]